MKAAILTAFGSPLHLEEIPDPTPGAGDVVVSVLAAPVIRYLKEVFARGGEITPCGSRWHRVRGRRKGAGGGTRCDSTYGRTICILRPDGAHATTPLPPTSCCRG